MGWFMTYVNELESDFSVFHRLDIWVVSFARLIRLAPRIPAYDGALRHTLTAERTAAPTPAIDLSTSCAQTVDNPAAEGDTPAYIVAQRQHEAMLAQFRAQGVDVTAVEVVSDDELERLVNGG